MDDEISKKPVVAVAVGDNLESVSINELHARLEALKGEIRRVESEIVKKQASKAAADSFFKS